MKSIADSPEVAALTHKISAFQSDLNEVSNRQSQLKERVRQQALNTDVVACLVDDEDSDVSDNSLREQLAQLDERTRHLNKKLEAANTALATAKNRASKTECQNSRAEFVQEARKILGALKIVCGANVRLTELRNNLERAGFSTSFLPDARFTAADVWHDPRGGAVTFYRKLIAENFPELTDETK
jgi:chromosome segregation ATPase